MDSGNREFLVWEFIENSLEITNDLIPSFFEFCYYTPRTLRAMAISTYESIFYKN